MDRTPKGSDASTTGERATIPPFTRAVARCPRLKMLTWGSSGVGKTALSGDRPHAKSTTRHLREKFVPYHRGAAC